MKSLLLRSMRTGVLACFSREHVYLTAEMRCRMLPGMYIASLTSTGSQCV